jgi:hypothetical protein
MGVTLSGGVSSWPGTRNRSRPAKPAHPCRVSSREASRRDALKSIRGARSSAGATLRSSAGATLLPLRSQHQRLVLGHIVQFLCQGVIAGGDLSELRLQVRIPSGVRARGERKREAPIPARVVAASRHVATVDSPRRKVQSPCFMRHKPRSLSSGEPPFSMVCTSGRPNWRGFAEYAVRRRFKGTPRDFWKDLLVNSLARRRAELGIYGSRDPRYAASAIRSSSVSLATTPFINSTPAPFRWPFCMSLSCRNT